MKSKKLFILILIFIVLTNINVVLAEDSPVSTAVRYAKYKYSERANLINESNAVLFEENNGYCLVIISPNWDYAIGVAVVVQKGTNKIVYSTGIQDYWDGMIYELLEKADESLYAEFNGIKNTITIIVNGNKVLFNQAPYNQEGITMVPMRPIFEALGITVNYDINTKVITANKNGTTLEFVAESSILKINGNPKDTYIDIMNINGTTMIPLRFVSEAFGDEVSWNSETKTITIIDKNR